MHKSVVEERRFGRKGSPWEFNVRDMMRWCQLLQANTVSLFSLTCSKCDSFNYEGNGVKAKGFVFIVKVSIKQIGSVKSKIHPNWHLLVQSQ